MDKLKKAAATLADLRRKAEQRLSTQRGRIKKLSAKGAQDLVQELGTHQIELEMQIEELQRAQADLETSRSKYSDLYDFAPVGYFTFDKAGLVREVNLTGARLLGIERGLLVNKPFSGFVGKDDRDAFRAHCSAVLKGRAKQTIEIRLKRRDKTEFFAQFESVAVEDPAGNVIAVRTAVSDITVRKRAEEALVLLNEDLEKRVMDRTVELRNLQAHVEAVREGERAHIAREVHDQLGQSMTALNMDIAWLKKHHPSLDATVRQHMAGMLDLVGTAIQAVKKITAELRPSILDDFGLQAAVDLALQEFAKRSGAKCRVLSRPASITLDRTRSTVVYRVLQESLSNVARHAKAANVTVSLELEGGQFRMDVQDDGKGIAAGKIDDPTSYGLRGMRERVRFLGGDITISGGRGRGTTVTVSIPVSGDAGPGEAARRAKPSSTAGRARD